MEKATKEGKKKEKQRKRKKLSKAWKVKTTVFILFEKNIDIDRKVGANSTAPATMRVTGGRNPYATLDWLGKMADNLTFYVETLIRLFIQRKNKRSMTDSEVLKRMATMARAKRKG